MPENSTASTKVFRATSLPDDDPNAMALTEMTQHIVAAVIAEKEDGLRKRNASEDSMKTSISKDSRHYAWKVAAGVVGLASALATGVYQYGGPAAQVEKADAAVVHVDEKMVQLDAKTKELDALKADIEKARQARVTGRLSGVENRMATVEGTVAGIRVGQDALLDATLTEGDAKEAKAQASKQAAATESQAKVQMTADAMAEH